MTMRSLPILALAVLAAGCTQTTERSHQRLIAVGTIDDRPVELEITGESSSESRTRVDSAAIAAAAGQAARAALDGVAQQIPGAPAIAEAVRAVIGPPAEPSGVDGGLLAAGGTAATAVAWALREMLNARAHKRDADEGWDRALKSTEQPKESHKNA